MILKTRELDSLSIDILREILVTSIKAACKETAYEQDQTTWSPSDPLKGHSGAIAWITQVVLGGDILWGLDYTTNVNVIFNQLPCGIRVGLTLHDPFNPPIADGLLHVVPSEKYMKFLDRFESALYNTPQLVLA